MISSISSQAVNRQAPTPSAPTPPQHGPVRDTFERASGYVGGALGTVYHLPMGVLEGSLEGLASHKHEGNGISYQVMNFATSLGAGVAVGAVAAGTSGVGLGLLGGLAASAVSGTISHLSGADARWMDRVESAVDKAVDAHKQGPPIKVAVQNATEGALIGGGVGAREGASIGQDWGRGVASGLCDFTEGLGEGVAEFLRSLRS